MNKYDELYIFRKANIKDVDRLMEFIRTDWRANHILGSDREFLIYEHGNGDEINFILCEDKKSGSIVGMHGFIPYSKDKQFCHICGVMTMVKKDVPVPMLGAELIKRFIEITQYSTYCGIGTNSRTMVPLVKRLFHRFVGKMEHYYKLNDSVTEFKIAKIESRKSVQLDQGQGVQAELVEFYSFDDVKKSFQLNQHYKNLPYKEDWYIKKRYFDHPIYHYRVWGVNVGGKIQALLMGRKIELNDTKIMRFVDFIGNIKDLALISDGVKNILQQEQYEYADFLLCGVSEEIMNKAGFVLNKEEDFNIIPNYFEPFVQQNVEIWFETSHPDMILFKADADADRPNHR
ncbi:MAG: hypothetical protein K0S04_1308 [Herbinix sp.]|jgi:hypothetical protein|nr:hypothetical protein [Herbinix sp.]